MTYKNTTFDQSPTMLSLEKIAAEKGWLKNDPIKKEAKKKSPEDLLGNLVVLCEKLRENGFNNYARDLESKFLLMKTAASKDSCYDVTNETGEDVIENAHQDGSVKLDKKWSDDGIVETVLDQHKKVLDVIKKMPKGKLSSKNIINAVKIVLAEDVKTKSIKDLSNEELDEKIEIFLKGSQRLFNKAFALIKNQGDLTQPLQTLMDPRPSLVGIVESFFELTNQRPVLEKTIREAIDELIKLNIRTKPSIMGGVPKDIWPRLESLIEQSIGMLKFVITLLRQQFDNTQDDKEGGKRDVKETPQQATTTSAPENARKEMLAPLVDLHQKIMAQYSKLISQISVLQGKHLKPEILQGALQFISDASKDLARITTQISTTYPQVSEGNMPGIKTNIENDLRPIEKEIADFYKEYKL